MSHAVDNPSTTPTNSNANDEIDPATMAEGAAEDDRYAQLLQKKRTEFLDHMLRSLDIVTYCHFSCSLPRFFIRSAVQLNYLTPKPAAFPVSPQRRPAIITIFASFALCALLHLFTAAPSAGELTRGYLHGGLITDFIGQEGPISKLRLLSVDTIILLLQLLMLTISVTKQTHEASRTRSETRHTTTPVQDLDSEERGEIRRHSISSESSADTAEVPGREQEGLLNEIDDAGIAETDIRSSWRRRRERKAFEISSGEFVVTRIDLVGILRQQWAEGRRRRSENPDGPPSSPSASSSSVDESRRHSV
ncbi:hypothetical protein RUND412_002384 [Rhizina undulata]